MDQDDPLHRRDELPAGGRNDVVAVLQAQDLDPLSVAELERRITALGAEIDRTRARLGRAVNHRASADGLFRR